MGIKKTTISVLIATLLVAVDIGVFAKKTFYTHTATGAQRRTVTIHGVQLWQTINPPPEWIGGLSLSDGYWGLEKVKGILFNSQTRDGAYGGLGHNFQDIEILVLRYSLNRMELQNIYNGFQRALLADRHFSVHFYQNPERIVVYYEGEDHILWSDMRDL